ncbi:hypothetical protein SEMRO_3737_G350730.1 [Seminavis robusta]|uniref:Uncharacterized protein n=1 Tax=Seminavis robusta TaxID=568900 RepID=A0A9N8I1J6_9STRA|nr:hypothetical protein SEMRO_3737_G350730.1 [Seminavis robusta]|eukprot:Sro3737_g350730.1 n/a (318) ;mRNA; r:3439-4392
MASRPRRATGTSHSGPAKPKYGQAQADWIKKVHFEVEAKGASFFKAGIGRDWSQIAPHGGRNTCLNQRDPIVLASTMYVRPVACWIPHLLIPSHLPSCPHCEKNNGISLNPKLDWVATPKILYGLYDHRYLDTIYYKCEPCKRKFTGYNEKSLELDSNKLIGIFNFHVSRGVGVDQELYAHIVNRSCDPTAAIYRGIAQGVANRYINDSLFYYQSCAAKKVAVEPRKVVPGTNQRTIDSMIKFVPPPTESEKKRRKLENDLSRARRAWEWARDRATADITFQDIFRRKSNRNNLNLSVQGYWKTEASCDDWLWNLFC